MGVNKDKKSSHSYFFANIKCNGIVMEIGKSLIFHGFLIIIALEDPGEAMGDETQPPFLLGKFLWFVQNFAKISR